jgi:hypothetical protein
MLLFLTKGLWLRQSLSTDHQLLQDILCSSLILALDMILYG